MQRYDHLSSTLKAFMLDKPDATREELKEHLRVMAEQLWGGDRFWTVKGNTW
ncbi:hypothetical protein [Serratia marcescens]|uniref:hypothetical protein n=1 Tax=Serratia marcescens TaxID=615 RepID=UPI0015E8E578|nr:hypothetical protein [Serratia marcescens]MDS0829216.1 hypothetical protein [Serratia marcescens]